MKIYKYNEKFIEAIGIKIDYKNLTVVKIND